MFTHLHACAVCVVGVGVVPACLIFDRARLSPTKHAMHRRPTYIQIMRVCLSFLVVEQMRAGVPVAEACRQGIKRLKECVALSHPRPATSFSTFSLGACTRHAIH